MRFLLFPSLGVFLWACGPNDPTLPAELIYPNNAGELVVADLNGDGLPEIAAASGTNAFVFFGQNEKKFSSAVSAALSPISLRATLSAADLDQDGSFELLATGTVVQNNDHFSQVFRPQNETFASPAQQLLEGGIFASPYHAVGDFDGDGDGDLAVIQDDQVFVYPGDGDTFGGTPSIIPVGRSILSRSLSVGDVDGDGKDDLAGCGAEGVILLFGEAGPTLVSPTFLSDEDQVKTRIADLNQDGRPDVVSVGRGTPNVISFSFSTSRAVTVLPVFAIGGLSGLVGYVDFVPADFDGDGVLDVAAIRVVGGGSSFEVGLSQKIGGSFIAGPTLATPVASQNAEIEAGDLDGNGFLDVVVSDTERARIAADPGKLF